MGLVLAVSVGALEFAVLDENPQRVTVLAVVSLGTTETPR